MSWPVVRHADIGRVSKDSATFCSGKGIMLDYVPDEVSEASAQVLFAQPAPHSRLAVE